MLHFHHHHHWLNLFVTFVSSKNLSAPFQLLLERYCSPSERHPHPVTLHNLVHSQHTKLTYMYYTIYINTLLHYGMTTLKNISAHVLAPSPPLPSPRKHTHTTVHPHLHPVVMQKHAWLLTYSRQNHGPFFAWKLHDPLSLTHLLLLYRALLFWTLTLFASYPQESKKHLPNYSVPFLFCSTS